MRNKNREDHSKNIENKINLISYFDKFSPSTEQYRTLGVNLQTILEEKGIKDIVITSSFKGEGKTTTTTNLAIIFASLGYNTLLVDADLRKPKVARAFGLKNSPGFSNVLKYQSKYTLENTIVPLEIENLSILTSGSTPQNSTALLNSSRTAEVMMEMREKYDLVLYDMPPVLMVTDALILSKRVGGTILVIREGVSEKKNIKKQNSCWIWHIVMFWELFTTELKHQMLSIITIIIQERIIK